MRLNKQIVYPVLIGLFLLIATIGVVLFAKGYRFDFNNGSPAFGVTGQLVLKSVPDGAQVFIDNHLTTATNNTINLTPGSYDIKIEKDGYFPWQKKLFITKEVVTSVDALLFPTSPSAIQSITQLGALNPVIDPSQTRIAYVVASQSASVNGVYILDISSRPLLTLQSSSTQLVDDTNALFSQAKLSWSPDGKNILARIDNQSNGPTYYLLDPNNSNQTPQDVTETLGSLQSTWNNFTKQQNKALLDGLKDPLRNFVTQNMNILAWSPDETKILYQATSSASFPYMRTPRLIGLNSTPESRQLNQNSIYVYDIKNDQNFLITLDNKSSESLFLKWFPDSNHLVYVHNKKVDIMEYDSMNQTTIYAGPFIDHYLFTAANDVSKIIISTDFGNTNTLPNLYSISLQ